MAKLPILKLEELNPVLFASIEELNEVKVLRQQLLQIKKYLTSCKNALESRLLWQLGDRFHFIENENTYSLQDLIDLRSGDLLQYLNKLQDAFIKHIKIDCQVSVFTNIFKPIDLKILKYNFQTCLLNYCNLFIKILMIHFF